MRPVRGSSFHSGFRLSGRGSRRGAWSCGDVILLGALLLFSLVSVFHSSLVDCAAGRLPDKPTGWNNPFFERRACGAKRSAALLGLTPDECDFGKRVVFSVALGALIGYERRQPDKPAGIRTMSLAALGGCTFTLCSSYAFDFSPMLWDSSRISAAIPSGVGFLGAGLIWKGRDPRSGVHEVRGLTTAGASLAFTRPGLILLFPDACN